MKGQISMHLLEIRLFSHDIVQVLKSTGAIVAKNFVYLSHNLLPMLVMLVPMVALMVQLVAHYAYAPSAPGATELLRLELDPDAGVLSVGGRMVDRPHLVQARRVLDRAR